MGLISRASSRTYRLKTTFDQKMALKNTNTAMADVEATMKRIQSHKGVIGLIINNEGIPIRTSLDNSTTVQYAQLIIQLTKKSRSVVRDLDPQGNLRFLRLQSNKHEIMIAPEKDYLLVVIRDHQQ